MVPQAVDGAGTLSTEQAADKRDSCLFREGCLREETGAASWVSWCLGIYVLWEVNCQVTASEH